MSSIATTANVFGRDAQLDYHTRQIQSPLSAADETANSLRPGPVSEMVYRDRHRISSKCCATDQPDSGRPLTPRFDSGLRRGRRVSSTTRPSARLGGMAPELFRECAVSVWPVPPLPVSPCVGTPRDAKTVRLWGRWCCEELGASGIKSRPNRAGIKYRQFSIRLVKLTRVEPVPERTFIRTFYLTRHPARDAIPSERSTQSGVFAESYSDSAQSSAKCRVDAHQKVCEVSVHWKSSRD